MARLPLISRLRAAASVSALRAASGGCASTRACGRSPKGEAADTRKAHLCGRAFRAGVRNRKRRMAIVKGCNLTPGCVFTVRGGGAASKENGVIWAGCCLRGNNPSRRGASYMRPSTGSHLRADTGAAPTQAREKITRYRTACGCSRAGASNPRRRCSQPRRRRHAGHPSRG